MSEVDSKYLALYNNVDVIEIYQDGAEAIANLTTMINSLQERTARIECIEQSGQR